MLPFFVLMILLASCGCIDTQDAVGYDDMQNGTAEGLPINGSFTPASAANGGTEDTCRPLADRDQGRVGLQPECHVNLLNSSKRSAYRAPDREWVEHHID